jgi:hypothetical protein
VTSQKDVKPVERMTPVDGKTGSKPSPDSLRVSRRRVDSNHHVNGTVNGKKRGWREIEALRERAELKEHLAEIWDDDIELDENVFGDCAEVVTMYRKSDVAAVDFEDEEDIRELLEKDRT